MDTVKKNYNKIFVHICNELHYRAHSGGTENAMLWANLINKNSAQARPFLRAEVIN